LGINEGEATINKVMIIGTRSISNEAIKTPTKEEEKKETMAINNRKERKWRRKNKSYLGKVMMEGGKNASGEAKKMLNEVSFSVWWILEKNRESTKSLGQFSPRKSSNITYNDI
jgi:hypothetical protein